MGITKKQRKFIRNNISHLSPRELAARIGLTEGEILEYLDQNLPEERYQKYLLKKKAQPQPYSVPHAAPTNRTSEFFKKNFWEIALLVILTAVTYANSARNAFISDDIPTILDNKQIGQFGNVFNSPLHFSALNLLRYTTFHLGELNPLIYRLPNLAAHLGSALLVFLILSRMANRRVGLITASLFAVHPLLTEAVVWISAAPYSISAFFFLLAFWLYIRAKSASRYYIPAVFSYALAVLFSEKAVVLFAAIILWEFLFGDFRSSWKKLIPFAAIGGTLVLFYATMVKQRASDLASVTYQSALTFNPLTQIPSAIGGYWKLAFWPKTLTLLRSQITTGRMDLVYFYIITALFFALLIWSWRKNRLIFFWLVFFLIVLSPTLTPFRIAWIIAERYVYLASIGIFVTVAAFSDWMMENKVLPREVMISLLTLLVAILGWRTISRNHDWRDPKTFWSATVASSPKAQSAHIELGSVYFQQGDLQNAIAEFQQALMINPNHADAYHNLAVSYYRLGMVDQAIYYYSQALVYNPKQWQSYLDLSAIYYDRGQYDLASQYYQKALELTPPDQRTGTNPAPSPSQ